MRHTIHWKASLLIGSLLALQALGESTPRGVLSVQEVEIGSAGEFSVNSAAVSGASCQGEMSNHHSGLVEFQASSCGGSFSSRTGQKRSGLKLGSFRLMRSFLDETYFDTFASSAACPSTAQTFNYLLVRARTPDAGIDFSSNSAFAAGVVAYNPATESLSGSQRWTLGGDSNTSVFTYNKRSSSCSNGKLVVTKTTASDSVFDTNAIAYFTSDYGYWKSTTGNYQSGVLMPQQALNAQVLSSKSNQAYAGLYTHYYKKWLETRRFIYVAPNNAAGTEFKIYEALDPSDFSQKTELGVLNCNELNAPTSGFCKGTFSRAGVAEAGKALCLFGSNVGGQDLWFCEAQAPDTNSSYHLKTLATFQFQTTPRARLAVVSPEFVNLSADESSREITVTVKNPSSKPTAISPAAVAPSDVAMPASFTGASTTFFENSSQCGAVLAPFSSCQFKITFNPSDQKMVADYLRVTYDKADGSGAVNATAVFQAAKGLTGISISAPTAVTLGQSASVTTTASFANGQTLNVTGLTDQALSNRTIASVNSTSNIVNVTGSIAGTTQLISTFGSFTAQTSITVVAPPVAPSNFTAALSDNTSAVLSWQNGGNPDQRYQLAYNRNSAPVDCNSGTVISAAMLAKNLSYTLTSLIQGSTYHFRLCGVSDSNNFSSPVAASVSTPVVGVTLIATNGQVLNDSTTYSSIIVPNGVTLNIGPSFSGVIGNLTVKSGGILTASNSFSDSNPSADLFNLGNTHGRLYLALVGDLTVESGGLITMDGKGYPGGGNGPGHNGSRAHGLSHSGYGATGAGLNFAPTANCFYTWRAGGGGGYGTPGGSGAPLATGGAGGTSFGASDFTTKLYLGSGGAGGACWDQGGKGGGAIFIQASNISVAGTISAQGTKPSVNGGGGSGGTIVLNASGNFSHTGAITTAGGTNGTSSNIGGTGRLRLTAASFTAMSGSMVGVVPAIDGPLTRVVAALGDTTTTLTRGAYGGSAIANTGTILNMASLKVAMGSQAPSEQLSFLGAGHFDFNASLEQAGYDIVIGDQQHFYLNASWGQPRNVTVESGGVVTANAYAISNPSQDSFNLSSMGRSYGNGRLIMDQIQGTFHVKAGGYVTMSGKGHLGGGNLPGNNGSMAHGQSPQGYGLGGAGRAVTGINCYHSYRFGSGGSYGEAGGTIASGGAAGTVYGASDFDTQLYLGSGGGGSGCWERGGTGGGAIYVGAQNIINEGYIDASGRKAYHANGGGGSGGTIVLNASSSVTNSGKVNAEGGRGVMSYSLSHSSFYGWEGWNAVVYSHPWYLYDSRRGVGRGTNADWQSWIQADMGANKLIDVITLSPHDWWPSDHLNDRLLQYHNGSAWVTYKTIAGTTLARDNYFMPSINARYWRVINPDHRRSQHIFLGEFVLDSSAEVDSFFLANKGGKGRVKLAANSVSSVGSIVGIVADAVPFITTQPVNRTAAEGQSAQFSAVAGIYDGSTPLYQWQVSTDNGANFTDIAGATSSSYTIASVSTGQHNQRYRVRVSAAGVPYSGPSSMVSNAGVLKVYSALADGSSAERAAPSAIYIKNNFPNSADGVYWIDLPSSGPTPVYCIMNSAVSGGGWMMAMKATRANTFHYDSTYWTQNNTLNTSATNRADGDAKFAVMNEYAANDALALWPDLGAGGDIAGIDSSWVWLENGVLGNKALTTFFATQTQTGMNRIGGTQWAGQFSSQGGYQFYGFNYTSGRGWSGEDRRVRWGFGWNNEGDQNSNDASGGIGMGATGWSAGDWIGCCQNTTGFNRSARVEIYIR